MSSGTTLDRDFAIAKVLKAKGNLRDLIVGIESRGDCTNGPFKQFPIKKTEKETKMTAMRPMQMPKMQRI